MWQLIGPSNDPKAWPAARWDHVCIPYKDQMIMFVQFCLRQLLANTSVAPRFGGGGNYYKNDIWLFDPKMRKWSKQHSNGAIPSVRDGPGAASIDDVVYTFGGYRGGCLGDLHQFTIASVS
jgi:hypothetical protein